MIHSKKGFSLPDILIAITVFLLASTALFGLIAYTARISTYVIHSFEATQLAREGIEIMENIRGANTIQHLTWTLKETDEKWETSGIFSEQLKNSKKVCLKIGHSTNTRIPWDIESLPNCSIYENTSTIKDSSQKMQLVQSSSLQKTTTPDNKTVLAPGNSTPADTSETHYGRVITLELKSRDTYNLDLPQTSQHTLRDDDILEVTSRVFWMEGGELKNIELRKIFTRWSI